MNKNLKVVNLTRDTIEFENGFSLSSNHEQNCCESHELYIKDLTLDEFQGLEFDLSNDRFFNRVSGYGIELLPIHGHPIRIAGHGSNNGYYSDQLDLIVNGPDCHKVYNITECQDISG